MRKVQQSLVIEGDTVRAMYTEGSPIDVRDIGTISRAEKVSDVKYNVRKQRWEAIDRRTKKVIAFDRSRPACVLKEHAYYERRIARGAMPWK